MQTRGRIVVSVTPRNLSDEDLSALGPEDLDADEKAHALTLPAGPARAQFVGRRVQLRRELAAITGMRPEEISSWREPCLRCGAAHGRPRAVGFAGYFSSSSTSRVTALAVADAPVGLDVEELASIATIRDVTPLLHLAERARIDAALAIDTAEARRVFTQIWTRKEALLKATGEGLTAPLDRDDVSNPATRPVPGWQIVDITRDLVGHGDFGDLGHAGGPDRIDAPRPFETHGAWASPAQADSHVPPVSVRASRLSV